MLLGRFFIDRRVFQMILDEDFFPSKLFLENGSMNGKTNMEIKL